MTAHATQAHHAPLHRVEGRRHDLASPDQSACRSAREGLGAVQGWDGRRSHGAIADQIDGLALAIGTPAYVVQRSLPDLTISSAQ
jgi:hypothetical protein